MSASRPSIDCDGGTGSQVIDDPRDNPFPNAPYPAWVSGIVRTVGGLRLERWAPSRQNAGRHQIGIGGRLTLKSAGGAACACLLADSVPFSAGRNPRARLSIVPGTIWDRRVFILVAVRKRQS